MYKYMHEKHVSDAAVDLPKHFLFYNICLSTLQRLLIQNKIIVIAYLLSIIFVFVPFFKVYSVLPIIN